MASWVKRWEDGNLREVGDDATRRVHTYDEQGVEILPDRAYTPEEVAASLADAAVITAATNKATIEQALSDALATLQAILDTPNATINAGPAPYIKDLARAQRRTIRLLIRRFDGTA